jgi:hypothetical protein
MDKRPVVLTISLTLMVLNGLVTAIHYLLILLKVVVIHGEFVNVIDFAVADTIVTTVPSLLAAFGLWRYKRWAWIMAMVACGGYLHGMMSLLTQAVVTSRYSAMNFVSMYFTVFSLFLIVYLWRQKEHFR